MDGAASDLRTGLPWQGVDIHEPVRLLFIIEATTQTLLKLIDQNSTLRDIFHNHWSHLATIDPNTSQMYRFSKDRFVLYQPELSESERAFIPTAANSQDWYRGKREHLSFALIEDSVKTDLADQASSAASHLASKAVST
jgi:hypothetical protein